LLSYSWNILGISKFLWEIKHHHSHHIYTNIPHRDIDIAESPLLRFSPVYPYRSYFKYQHLYAVLLYFVFGVFIVYVKDFIMFFTGPFKSHKRGNLPRYFLIQLVITKLLFLTISLIIPLMVLPYAWWKILATYLICLSVSGALLLLVLLVPHINADAVIDKTNYEMRNQDDWVLSQISTTVDSSVNSLFLNWFTGGLNTHLVHHLFPNICHTHYIPLTKIVKQVLSEHGIKYKENNFSSSIINHFKFLKLMGMEPVQFQELKH
jgi:linoleoyl-CoA desaturase